jgi:hypothetical protein
MAEATSRALHVSRESDDRRDAHHGHGRGLEVDLAALDLDGEDFLEDGESGFDEWIDVLDPHIPPRIISPDRPPFNPSSRRR